MHNKKLRILLILMISLLVAGAGLAADTPAINRWIIGAGGGTTTNGATTLNGTIGQWVVGNNITNNTQLSHGFWFSPAEIDASNAIYLPLIIR